jgi:hypothetical protein
MGVGRCARRAVGAVALSAVAAATGAASGAGAGDEPMTSIQSAVAATLHTSAAMAVVLKGRAIGGVTPPPVTGSGTFDFASSSGTLTLSLPSAPGAGSAKQQTLFLPTVVYLRPPSARAAALPAGKSWIVASLTETESTSTNFSQFVLQEEGLSPLLELSQLVWGATSARTIASRTIGGVPAQGYAVVVDLSRAEQQASGPAAGSLVLAIKAEIMALGAGASPNVTESIWVAGGKVVAISVSPPGAGVGTATTTLSRFGTTVKVTAPATSVVVDIASLTPGGEQEFGPEHDVA